MTLDGQTMRGSINGKLLSEPPLLVTMDKPSPVPPLKIGETFTATIDSVKQFDHALTALEAEQE